MINKLSLILLFVIFVKEYFENLQNVKQKTNKYMMYQPDVIYLNI
jgi:surface polysaccharide O-acyltransferase-like enzyme